MKGIKSFVVKYAHGMLTLGVGLIVFFLTLHFVQQYGPSFLKQPAQSVGDLASGNKWGY